MKFFALICSAKFWLTLMLSLTMSVGALAGDIHPADAEDIACQSTDISATHVPVGIASDVDNNDPENRPAHDHHAHHCGTCHIHVVSAMASKLSFTLPASLNFRPGADQAAPRAGPLGLYRPPRA